MLGMLALGVVLQFQAAPAASASEAVVLTNQTSTNEDAVAKNQMTAWKAMVLGAVEGITEYLPISSTGHLVVTQRILGIGDTPETKDAADSYAIAIQFGAILAVLVLYRKRIQSILRGLFGKDAEGRNLLISLVLAFLPAVVIGVAIEKPIKSNLLNVGPIVGAWIVGGLLLLYLAPKIKPDRVGFAITAITPKHALIIGGAQVLAMWPGTSRSLVTILAALAVGTTLAAAVEFSFLLGLMTLGAATLFESAKDGPAVIDAYGWFTPLVGLFFAFLFAALAVKWMVTWLQTRSLAIFGWERLTVAAISIGLLAAGTI
jgi:undecaprenyl-diphosphatase